MNYRNRGSLLAKVGLVLALMALAALIAGCDEDSVEKSIGKQTAASVEQEYGVNNDPVMQEWVDTLGHRLVGQSPRQNIAYHFKVVNTDMVNAFAAPYGYVYVTQGFLGFAQSEDEVAFVLGHEVGHVANRDSIKSLKKSILFNIGVALAGSRSDSLSNMGGIGAGLLLLHYSRGDEQDADTCGCQYSYCAGYDPQGGIDFFNRLSAELEKDKPSSLEHIFLSHPPTDSRIAATKARPEENLQDPAVASHIGRTYARRYAFATATRYYNMALEKKPEAVETRLTLADAYEKQGLYDRAKTQYEAVLQRDPGNVPATTGLQAMGVTPQQYAATQAADQQLASASLPTAGLADQETAALVATSANYANTAAKTTATNSAVAKGSITSLMDISGQSKELGDRGNEVFVQGNAAVSAANDCAFTMESINSDLARITNLLRANALAARAGLERAAQGQGMAGDAAIYRRALMETRYGDKQIERAIEAAQATTADVQTATRNAATTVSAMSTMVNSKTPSRYIFPVRSAAEDTSKQAQAAREGVNKVKRMTAMAESRALLAKLNLAALGAPPEVRRVYDGMVAYYCNTTPQQVADLRQKGLGFGDAAFVLMAARSTQAPAASYLSVVNDNAVIEGLKDHGFNFQGPLPLLRFLSNAMDREATARG